MLKSGEDGSLKGSRREKNLLTIEFGTPRIGSPKGTPIRWRWQCQFESSILKEQSLCQKEATTSFSS